MANSSLTYLPVIRWSAREHAFVAKAPGLSGCIGTGESYQAALQSCLEAMQWRAEQAETHRQPLPPAEVSWLHRTAAEETEAAPDRHTPCRRATDKRTEPVA